MIKTFNFSMFIIQTILINQNSFIIFNDKKETKNEENITDLRNKGYTKYFFNLIKMIVML